MAGQPDAVRVTGVPAQTVVAALVDTDSCALAEGAVVTQAVINRLTSMNGRPKNKGLRRNREKQ